MHLGPTEFRLLEFLMQHPRRVFSREELLDAVWGPDIHVEPRTVDVHIRRLRKAINGPGELDVVRTVRAAGYALDTEPRLTSRYLQRTSRCGLDRAARRRTCYAAAGGARSPRALTEGTGPCIPMYRCSSTASGAERSRQDRSPSSTRRPASRSAPSRMPRSADLDRALDAADKGFAVWRKVSAFERSKIMRKAAELLRERADADRAAA